MFANVCSNLPGVRSFMTLLLLTDSVNKTEVLTLTHVMGTGIKGGGTLLRK